MILHTVNTSVTSSNKKWLHADHIHWIICRRQKGQFSSELPSNVSNLGPMSSRLVNPCFVKHIGWWLKASLSSRKFTKLIWVYFIDNGDNHWQDPSMQVTECAQTICYYNLFPTLFHHIYTNNCFTNMLYVKIKANRRKHQANQAFKPQHKYIKEEKWSQNFQ